MAEREDPFRIAYIIRAHHAPSHLARLVERLSGENASFFVHVNRLTDDSMFDEMKARLDGIGNVTWLPRVACRWGGFSLLRATLVGIEAVARTEPRPGHVLLLSGQDYPLRRADEIEAFFRENAGTSFVDHFPLPGERWRLERGGLDRIEYFHFERVKVRTRLLRLPFPRRRHPTGLRPYGGSAFWNLTGECVAYVRDFMDENPGFVRFYRHVKFPDELFFHTIVMNSPFRDTIENDDLRFQDWSAGAANPAALGTRDVPRLLESGKLFARKFDAGSEALDLLDREALRVA